MILMTTLQANEERALRPLAQSITYLTDNYRQMAGERAADQGHERQLQEEMCRSESRESSQKCVLERRSQLQEDLTRQYKRLCAEAEDPTDPSSCQKAEFNGREGYMLEG